jgi:hypothetical protein
MSNQYNYATDVPKLNGPYTKYMASRVIDNPQNKLLELEVPTSIPDSFILELQFYSLLDNYLLTSVVLTSENTDAISVTSLRYSDTSVRTLLFIDFSKIRIIIDEGRLQLVTNFFIPEVGEFGQSQFAITKISPSRTEVQLALVPETITDENIQELRTFASPQINSIWAIEALKYICNQSQSFNLDIPTTTASLSFDIIQAYLPVSESNKINNIEVSGEYTASIKQTTQEILNRTYTFASQSIKEMMPVQTRFTDEMLINIVSSSLGKAVALGLSKSLDFKVV